MMKYLILLVLLMALPVHSQVTVGWGASCDYDMSSNANALQQAIDDGNPLLHITKQNEYAGSINISDSIHIKGGYIDCLNTTQTNINSVINASVDSGFSALFMANIEDADVLLDSLDFINGTDGGLYLTKLSGIISLNHVRAVDNTGQTGAGFYVFNSHTLDNPANLIVDIKNSVFSQNEALGLGGGIGCEKSNGNVNIEIRLSEGSVVHSNHANNRGGGIYVNGCSLNFQAGISTHSNNSDEEIYNNTADESGAGLSVQDAQIELTGSYDMAFDVFNNISGSLSQTNTSGGGLFALGASQVILTNTNIRSNQAQKYGAGLYSSIGSQITSDIALSGCGYSDYCSSIQSNELLGGTGGGAAMAATGGEVTVNRSLIQFNNSNDFGYLSYAKNDAEMTLEGNLIINNGNTQAFNNYNGFYLNDSAKLFMLYNTINRNSGFVEVIRADNDSSLTLIGNIVQETADILHSGQNVITNINCNMLSQTDNITAVMTDTIIGVVDFIDQSEFGDYHLQESSTSAMDVCSSVPYLPGNDLSNNQRGFDNTEVTNVNGLYDLGAYEFYPVVDNIFSNSFEQ